MPPAPMTEPSGPGTPGPWYRSMALVRVVLITCALVGTFALPSLSHGWPIVVFVTMAIMAAALRTGINERFGQDHRYVAHNTR